MKTLLPLSLFALFFSCTAPLISEKKWFNEDLQVKGNVKTITAFEYAAAGHEDEVELIKLLTKSIFEFDNRRNLISKTKIDSAIMEINYKIVEKYKYDSAGNLIEVENTAYSVPYRQKDTVLIAVDTAFYQNDSEGRLVKLKNSDGTFIYEHHTDDITELAVKKNKEQPEPAARKTFDSSGNESTFEIFTKGKFVLMSEYEHSALGKLTSSKDYSLRDGSIFNVQKFEHDKHGNVVNARYYSPPGVLKKETNYKYQYDSNGNWIKKSAFSVKTDSDIITNTVTKDELFKVIEREISYF